MCILRGDLSTGCCFALVSPKASDADLLGADSCCYDIEEKIIKKMFIRTI